MDKEYPALLCLRISNLIAKYNIVSDDNELFNLLRLPPLFLM